MWAIGMMDPFWWKPGALNHRWYRDDNAYADYREGKEFLGSTTKYLAVFYDGARASATVTFPVTKDAAPYTYVEAPFEVKPEEPMELKDADGSIKYKVTGIVCETKTLTFTMLNVSAKEEITVIMGIAPEEFTTDLFENKESEQKADITPAQPEPSAPQQGPWVCMCGAENNGNFCVECGTRRPV